MAISEKIDLSESETDSYDSEEDPIFDILEETRSNISKLSITKKNKSSISEEISEEAKEDLKDIVPEVDQQGFEIVQKSIDAGVVDKLKVDQCKLYLRKNGLRLTGNKDTLIARIKEHLDIVNGGGERKYPASSFTLNCKGDACTGDVVMFEQTVYEMFNIASRSSVGPPCGTRIVAGRIVKESYGAAKQQHTFTIEVLWSKGEKPLPPLHPLLIKGRNLYKLKTMRQRWQDEGERQKILLEKHNRGSVARLNRDTRIQEKEARKMLKADRLLRTENQNHKRGDNNTSKTSASFAANSRNCRQSNEQQNSRPTYQSPLIDVGNLRMQPEMHKISQQVHVQQKECMYPVPLVSSQGRGTSFFQNANVPRAEWFCKREVLGIINQNSHGYEHNMISNQFRGQFQQEKASTGLTRRPPGRPMNKQGQLCKYYPQGRCYFGEQCKFLHEC